MSDRLNEAGATLLDRFDAHARERPSKPALILRRGERFEAWSYADLARRVARWAAGLAGTAADGSDDRPVVLIVAEHAVDTYAAVLGAMRAGLTPGLLPPPSVRQPLAAYVEARRRIVARTRPRLVIAPAAHVDAAREAAAGLAPSSPPRRRVRATCPSPRRRYPTTWRCCSTAPEPRG